MTRLEQLAMLAGVHVPDYPPMESPPVKYKAGEAYDIKEPELANQQVPMMRLT